MGSGSHICLGNVLEQLSQSRWDVSVVIDCACPYGESKGGKRNEEIVLSYVLVVTFRKIDTPTPHLIGERSVLICWPSVQHISTKASSASTKTSTTKKLVPKLRTYASYPLCEPVTHPVSLGERNCNPRDLS